MLLHKCRFFLSQTPNPTAAIIIDRNWLKRVAAWQEKSRRERIKMENYHLKYIVATFFVPSWKKKTNQNSGDHVAYLTPRFSANLLFFPKQLHIFCILHGIEKGIFCTIMMMIWPIVIEKIYRHFRLKHEDLCTVMQRNQLHEVKSSKGFAERMCACMMSFVCEVERVELRIYPHVVTGIRMLDTRSFNMCVFLFFSTDSHWRILFQ